MRAFCWRTSLAGAGMLLVMAARVAAQGAAPSGAPASSAEADRKDFKAVCGACHDASMASDLRSDLEWRETVEQMVALGAKGAPEQFEAVRRFLLRTLTKVNVNTAEPEQLPLVLDISERTAQALVAYRARHGNFRTISDLGRVPGVDPARLAARKDRIVF